MDLHSYVTKNLNAILLSPSYETIIPGAVLNIKSESGTLYILKKIFSIGIYQQKYSVDSFNDYIWKYFKCNPADFESKLYEANIITESLTQNFITSNSLSLPQYGIMVASIFEKNVKSSIVIDKVQARLLVNYQSLYDLLFNFQQLQFPQKQWLENDLVVTESFYTTKLKWVFDSSDTLKWVLEYLSNTKLSDEFNYKQTTNQVIEISGTPTVPFAAKGFILKG